MSFEWFPGNRAASRRNYKLVDLPSVEWKQNHPPKGMERILSRRFHADDNVARSWSSKTLSLSLSLSLIFALARWLCELRIRRRVETWQTRWSSVPTYGDEAFGPGQSALVGTYVRIGRERIMGRKIGNVIGILFKSDRPTIARNISYIICLPSSTFKYACPFADPTIISSILYF